jgi:hypothetical protein
MFGEGRDPARCGFDPRFRGFAGVQLGREEGPWRGFGLLGWGRQGRGWGWGELPGSPGGSPRQVPGPLVALRVTVAVAECAGSARLRSVCGLGKGCGRCVSVSGTDDDCDEKMTIVRAEVRGARTPPTRAGARVTDSPRTKSHRPLSSAPGGGGGIGAISGREVRSPGVWWRGR